MSQHSMSVADGSGSAVRTGFNSALQAGVSLNAGASAPSTTYANMFWADTTNSLLKQRNNANSAWVTISTLNQGLVEQGLHTIFIPAGAMTARTTSGAASGSSETTTNKVMIETKDFDTASDEFVQFAVRMPKGWNASTVTAGFTWSHAATTTNFGVAWAIQGVAFANDDAADTAFGTAVVATDTGGTTDDIYTSPDTAAVAISNTPAKSEWVVFQVFRDVSDAGDTMAIDARLHGVSLYYTIDAGSDA